MLPPGCARLRANPVSTRNPQLPHTVGTVRVRPATVRTATCVYVHMTSGIEADQFRGQRLQLVVPPSGIANGNPEILPLDPAYLAKRFTKCPHVGLLSLSRRHP